MPENQRSPRSDALERYDLLCLGEAEILGRMPNSSNGTFLCKISTDLEECLAIYKPHRGERPLWDFPDGLYRREVAAYVLSEALSLHLIPPTVERHDLPFGVGSLQLFIDADFTQHYFDFVEIAELHDQLIALAALDIIANNSDRKGGHVLIDKHRQLWGIDNGLCFHNEPKLRTVIWEFGGEALPTTLQRSLETLIGRTPPELQSLLHPQEIKALRRRTRFLLGEGALPFVEEEYRHYPWPII